MTISDLRCRKIISSAGNETVEVEVTISSGERVTTSVPAGISAGKYEVRKVPPEQAVQQIEEMAGMLTSRDWEQASLDDFLAGANLGGNASLAVSTVFWEASRVNKVINYSQFPKLLLLLFEGGEHGAKNIAMQEFMIIESSIEEAAHDFKTMHHFLESENIETLVGAEGGFSPSIFDDNKVLATIRQVFREKQIALDAAGCFKSSKIDYGQIVADYNIASIEDPYSDDEWDKWREFYESFGEKIMVVGDDLTVTNPQRILRAVNPKVINAVIIKPNQIGTISGAMAAVKLAQEKSLKIIVSHRGEETGDDWIADFAVEVRADYVKFGGMDRGERVAKYNRLRLLGMA